MNINYSVLICQNYAEHFAEVGKILENCKFAVRYCVNSGDDIRSNIFKYLPEIIVFDEETLTQKEIDEIYSHTYDYGYKPSLFSISSTEYDGSRPYNFNVNYNLKKLYEPKVIVEHLLYVCKESPLWKKDINVKLHKIVVDSLKEFCSLSSRAGWNYLVDSIMIFCVTAKGKVQINKDIYVQIAKKYSVNTACVEHAMRSLITALWKNSDIETKQKYFSDSIHLDRRPSNFDFIIHVSENIYNNNTMFLESSRIILSE